jgi:hypothetical protein
VTGDGAATLADTMSVLGYFGNPGTAPDGNLRDRYLPNGAFPWRSGEANNGVDLTDVLVNLQQYGHSCVDGP